MTVYENILEILEIGVYKNNKEIGVVPIYNMVYHDEVLDELYDKVEIEDDYDLYKFKIIGLPKQIEPDKNVPVDRATFDRYMEIIEDLWNMDENDILSRALKDSAGYGTIYDMSDFDEIMDSETPIGIANMITYGDFKSNDPYFMFDGYSNLVSLGERQKQEKESDLVDECLSGHYSLD